MKYEIERKTQADAAYVKVGELNPSTGKVLSNHSYQFTNSLTGIADGTVSYRIRQIIDTSTATFTAVYIDTTSVTASGCIVVQPTYKELVLIQPNPVVSASSITLIVETPYAISNMTINVYDAKGSLMIQRKQSKDIGRITIYLPAGRLAAGKYFVKVWNGEKELRTVECIKL
jgi:hypothetical protein